MVVSFRQNIPTRLSRTHRSGLRDGKYQARHTLIAALGVLSVFPGGPWLTSFLLPKLAWEGAVQGGVVHRVERAVETERVRRRSHPHAATALARAPSPVRGRSRPRRLPCRCRLPARAANGGGGGISGAHFSGAGGARSETTRPRGRALRTRQALVPTNSQQQLGFTCHDLDTNTSRRSGQRGICCSKSLHIVELSCPRH
mmetsp:Transcript_19124/g.36593  ORF Transcript_19124/g.36593 Transcript_19124/m.36593 type:complete len:200 (+) Transcript_19124:864-1463(+)